MIRTRLTVTVIAAITGVTTFLSVATASAQAPRRVALVGGMLLTGYEVPPIHHAAVLIEGDKIVGAGPASEIKIPADATVIDTSGRVMLPGLIETHGHLVVLGHGSYDTWFPWINSHGGEATMTRVIFPSGSPIGTTVWVKDRPTKPSTSREVASKVSDTPLA